MPYKHDSKEIVNFYQRWRLLYAVRNKEFAAEHLKHWNFNSFPSSDEILQKELEAKQNGEQSPSLSWPAAIDAIGLHPLSTLQTITIHNQSVMNVDEWLAIESPRAHELGLMQKELALVYWYQKAYREREKTRTESGSIELGPQKKEFVRKAKQAWNELVHYKIVSSEKRNRLNSFKRSVGLWLWDRENSERCGSEIAALYFKEKFHAESGVSKRVIDGTEGLIKLLEKTNKCIKKVDVLPI